MIFAGRQAIDGDTAQVGPQVAEKLGLPQVTYAEEILEVREGALVIKRRLEHGTEVVECPIPAVVTVNASAAECRPRNAKRVMKYKGALAGSEIAAAPESPAAQRAAAKEYLRSSACRVRPRRSRGSRTWFSPPRRPRNSLPPTTTSMNLWLNSSRATRSVNAFFLR